MTIAINAFTLAVCPPRSMRIAALRLIVPRSGGHHGLRVSHEGSVPRGLLLPEERSRRRFRGVLPPRTECSTPTGSAVWMSLDVWIVGPELKRALVVRYHAD